MGNYKQILTHSEMQTFKACQQKWFNRYVLGFRRAPQSGVIFDGGIIHDCLENFYTGHSEGRCLNLLFDRFRSFFPSEMEFSQERHNLDRLMIVMRRYFDFYRGQDMTPATDPLTGEKMVEFEFQIPIYAPSGRASTKYMLQGKIDFVGSVPWAPGVWIVDHKTTKTSITDADFERLSIDQQMRTYAYALTVYLGVPIAGCAYNKICTTLPPEPSINKDGTVSIKKAGYDPQVFLETLEKQDAYLRGLSDAERKEKKLAACIDFEKYTDIIDYCKRLKWFGRRHVEYSEMDLKETQMEIYQTAMLMGSTRWFCKNDAACDHWSGCEYRAHCMGLPPDGGEYITADKKHTELSHGDDAFHKPLGSPFIINADEIQQAQRRTFDTMLEDINV